MRGTSETIAGILQPYNIRVVHKAMFTLRRLLTNVQENTPTARPLIGETAWNLKTQLNEHKQATKEHDLNNNIVEVCDSATCLIYSTNYYQRVRRESCFTNLEQTSLNRCQPLPAPYKRLINRKQ